MVYKVMIQCLKSKKECALKEVLGSLYDSIVLSHHEIEPESVKNYLKNPPVFEKDLFCSCENLVNKTSKLVNVLNAKKRAELLNIFNLD